MFYLSSRSILKVCYRNDKSLMNQNPFQSIATRVFPHNSSIILASSRWQEREGDRNPHAKGRRKGSKDRCWEHLLLEYCLAQRTFDTFPESGTLSCSKDSTTIRIRFSLANFARNDSHPLSSYFKFIHNHKLWVPCKRLTSIILVTAIIYNFLVKR